MVKHAISVLFMENLYSHLCILGEITTFLPLKETTHITFHTVCHSCCATETSHYTSSLWLTHMYFLWKHPHTSYCSQIVMRCHFAEWHGILLSRALLRHMQNKMSTLTSEQYFVQLIFDSVLPPFFSLFHTHRHNLPQMCKQLKHKAVDSARATPDISRLFA